MTNDNVSFETCWRGYFPLTPPITWIVRNAHLDRWVRFHALPGSKRYAEDASETAEILRRANILGDALFGDGGDCWLVSATYLAGYADEQPWPGLAHAFDARGEEEDEIRAVYAARVPWRAGAFDALLRRIADDDVHAVLWLDAKSGIVFAPYDGGFDVIFPTVEQAEGFRDFKPEWRSAHPGGW